MIKAALKQNQSLKIVQITVFSVFIIYIKLTFKGHKCQIPISNRSKRKIGGKDMQDNHDVKQHIEGFHHATSSQKQTNISCSEQRKLKQQEIGVLRSILSMVIGPDADKEPSRRLKNTQGTHNQRQQTKFRKLLKPAFIDSTTIIKQFRQG